MRNERSAAPVLSAVIAMFALVIVGGARAQDPPPEEAAAPAVPPAAPPPASSSPADAAPPADDEPPRQEAGQPKEQTDAQKQAESAESAEPAEQAEPEEAPAGPHLVISGHAMLDMGYQFGQSDPAWFDVLRPSKLPAFDNEFGEDGRFFASVRQSRLSFKGFAPTSLGELLGHFEFELFGTGVDEGQTTFRLRHAYAELGVLGAGQTWSPFMDPDVFPNSLEYWGPNGMVFFRNVQLRVMPVRTDHLEVVLALERPGASADQGNYAGRIELEGVQPDTPFPDVSGHVRLRGSWGHVQAAGIVRYIGWDDLNDDELDLSGYTVGWGVNLSSNIKLWEDVVRLQAVYGHAIQNYMNDAPADVGIENNPGDPVTPVVGVPLPILGLVAFYDRTWSRQWTSTLGYSLVYIDNSEEQAPSAFRWGQYALVNLLFYPVDGLMLGPEFQWARRDNKSDDFSVNDLRIQFSVKGRFSYDLRGGT